MILSDTTISQYLADGLLVIDDIDYRLIQPASVDIRLGKHIAIPKDVKVIDFATPQEVTYRAISDLGYLLRPNEFILADTVEYFEIPESLVARIEGKSSLGRRGLSVHSTAGFVDPGFKGTLTLEIKNNASSNMLLMADMTIAQISFSFLSETPSKLYGDPMLGSRYQYQIGPTPGRCYVTTPI